MKYSIICIFENYGECLKAQLRILKGPKQQIRKKTTKIAKKCPKCSFRALAGPYVLKIGPRDYHHCSQHIKQVQKPYQTPLDYKNRAFLDPE